jgi:hypothetical protein
MNLIAGMAKSVKQKRSPYWRGLSSTKLYSGSSRKKSAQSNAITVLNAATRPCGNAAVVQCCNQSYGKKINIDEVVEAIGSQFQLPKNRRYGALKDVVPVGRGRFTARSKHKSDRFLHQRAVGFVHAPRAILKPECPPRAAAGASSGRMFRPRASNHPRHRATSAKPQSLKRRDPAYVFSAPSCSIAILILPGGPLSRIDGFIAPRQRLVIDCGIDVIAHGTGVIDHAPQSITGIKVTSASDAYHDEAL